MLRERVLEVLQKQGGRREGWWIFLVVVSWVGTLKIILGLGGYLKEKLVEGERG